MSPNRRTRAEAAAARREAERRLAAARAQRPEAERTAARLHHERIENGLADLFRIALGGRP